MGAALPLPKYRCHKEVWALKIQAVTKPPGADDGSCQLEFVDRRYTPRVVDRRYVVRHNPMPGGYFVLYEDGYQSWSPADVFEDGYTLIE